MDSIHTIKLSKETPKLITFCVNTSINKKIVNEKKFPLKSKDEYKFDLKYLSDVGEIIFQIRKNVYTNTKSFIKIIN